LVQKTRWLQQKKHSYAPFMRHAPTNALQLKQNFEPTKMGRAK
jgi:hypothetical protein